MKIKKRKKSTRFRGTHTHGRGFKKKARGSGHRGGVGMAGTGKRGDQKKSLVLNLPYDYFGKKRTLGKKVKVKLKQINLGDIQSNLPSLVRKGVAKESSGKFEISLEKYKILSTGNFTIKANIKAHSASKAAFDKVGKSGGSIQLTVEEESD